MAIPPTVDSEIVPRAAMVIFDIVLEPPMPAVLAIYAPIMPTLARTLGSWCSSSFRSLGLTAVVSKPTYESGEVVVFLQGRCEIPIVDASEGRI